MIRAIRLLHSHGVLHRDIKPDNFCIQYGFDTQPDLKDIQQDNILVIDFGISKYYLNNHGQLNAQDADAHIPMATGKKQCGTARYCSLATHMGIEPSRRDDLETIGHVLLYFLRGGHLPWMNLPGTTKQEKRENAKKRMFETTFDELCKDLPMQMGQYMEYCRKLDFDEAPDYNYLIRLLQQCIEKPIFQFWGYKEEIKGQRISNSKVSANNRLVDAFH